VVEELEPGIRRITFRLPLGIDHVHCYLLRSSTGGFVLVDTGLGSRDPEAHWRPVLDALEAPIEAVVVTHLHPDHVGGARDVGELTGAPVHQGREDYAQCERVWSGATGEGLRAHWLAQGIPEATADGIVEDSGRLRSAVHWQPDPELLDPGDEVDGWQVEVLRGHADGHIVLVRDGVLIAGDTLLSGITPAIGLYPEARPDPLGDYFETLARIEALAPRIAYAGHREPIADPAARAREIRAHHEDRLGRTRAALADGPATPYEVSLKLFDADLPAMLRRFATAEALAHLVRLAAGGWAERTEDGRYH
jgi:glyoxylase-like metal-dependent hydrolase (beta-lactamase superfamily II)